MFLQDPIERLTVGVDPLDEKKLLLSARTTSGQVVSGRLSLNLLRSASEDWQALEVHGPAGDSEFDCSTVNLRRPTTYEVEAFE